MNSSPEVRSGQVLLGTRDDAQEPGRHAWKASMEAILTLIACFDVDLRAEVGIDVRTYDALLHVFNAGESGIRMTDLAREVVITKTGLTSLIDRLEKRSLVRREPDPTDRRSIRVTLSKKGERMFRAAARIHGAGIHDRVAKHMTDEEARLIIDVFERVKSANEASARILP